LLGPAAGGGLFGGQLQGSATPKVAASMLGNRSLTLPKGTAFTCALKTKVISAVSGLVGCQVQRNVFSDDGRVLLIERGSHLDGEYRIASVRPGTVRIPVLWTRIRTPLGVTVDIDSPAPASSASRASTATSTTAGASASARPCCCR
jgi:type IV secretion system protein VirB10